MGFSELGGIKTCLLYVAAPGRGSFITPGLFFYYDKIVVETQL